MKRSQSHNRATPAGAGQRVRYRIVNHQEAGVFDSMTGATLWALKNLRDWEWRIEPVGAKPM